MRVALGSISAVKFSRVFTALAGERVWASVFEVIISGGKERR